MRSLFTVIILNLVLIPLLWLLPSTYKVHIYTIGAVADAGLYLILSIIFFIQYNRCPQQARPGMTLRFILLQSILLFSLFLFKLSGLLLLKYFS